jgi:hypothetical protein
MSVMGTGAKDGSSRRNYTEAGPIEETMADIYDGQMQSQKDFLRAEFWMASWSASVQRSRLYTDRAGSDPARKIFQAKVRFFVDEKLLPRYTNGCTEKDHYANIRALEKSGSRDGVDLLCNGYPFGVAQKLLNVYLKYQWCSGWISEPPHCPIDRTILAKLKLDHLFIWTTMKESDYRAAIDELKRVSGSLSPARWELNEFRRSAAS